MPRNAKRKSVSAKAKGRATGRSAAAERTSRSAKRARKTEALASKEVARTVEAQAAEQADTETATDIAVQEEPSVERRGRRVGDIRAAERAERAARNRKRYRSYILKIVAVIVAILVVFFGAIFLYRSDVLAVRNVTVTGVSHLTDQEITRLAAVPDDSTLLRLDTDGIVSRLKEHPWVQDASVARILPDTIELQITERTPAAAVRISDKSIWMISTDGSWLSAATEDDWKNYRHIVDANSSLAAPVSGSSCSDEGVKNAIEIYDNVSDKLLEQIDSISAESVVKTQLNLDSGVVVAFGEASDIELKEADIWALLDKYDGKISYINVRVPDRPTYRCMDDSQ